MQHNFFSSGTSAYEVYGPRTLSLFAADHRLAIAALAAPWLAMDVLTQLASIYFIYA